MNKTVYIIGHRNPDTDAVVSAVSYAKLKNLLGMPEYKAARAGHLNPQTSYIFDKFNVPRPEYLPDLIPKVKFFMQNEIQTVTEDSSIWESIALMEKNENRVMSVVDNDGKYCSLLHYSGFAKGVLSILNPEKKHRFPTTIKLIQKTLNAQPIYIAGDADSTFKASIHVASSSIETFEKRLAAHSSEDIVVIASDRKDIHKICIEHKVKLLITTSNCVIDKELKSLAEKNGVSVIVSPYSTAPTSMLIAYSMPVSSIGDADIKTVQVNDSVSKIKDILKDAHCKYLPVVDENSKVVGMISEHDLMKEPNIEVILVDHNELSQAVEGVEHYKIQEVVDHHRIGAISTKNPITFINRPVGSTSTQIAGMYQEYKIAIPKDIASLLLCGILSDTLILQSATTTNVDIEMAEYLSSITDLDIKELGNEILIAGSNISGREAGELVRQDLKEYSEGKVVYTVSQIEVGNTKEVLTRKEEFIKELEIECRSRKALFSCLLVTDITTLSSIMLIHSDPKFEQFINFPKQEDNAYYLQGVVSRKKQLIPLLTERVSNYLK
ncbi:MAG: putative manganese-dependent inorganic diphosphatase [Treponema sp.]|uniref:putative manganese-dependent inorganic diphosphatase n=1 Tax=Treponema sp. TaxID=166 RepID=UPI001E086F6C|nr:putative manganese-dependent inorganic diphosphatase [Treponema sp.]MBS7311071.1 putative manganese-dependent inorganic diphosphatase [Treponema sp.]MCI5695904.1 putative manganese-dependent inorganic diphosphatase [Spirochaetia bacterium]MDD5812546.1 putative manganese-dependent inorganic diphosphatase [Treponema sp.]MDY5884868.1 putative manganese-dependent inorganic diphosphatase [Treponema sp.]